jgi:hypothetical protein
MVGRTDKISAQTAQDSNKFNIILGGISGGMGPQNFQQHAIRKDQVVNLIQMKFSKRKLSLTQHYMSISYEHLQSNLVFNYLVINQSFLLNHRTVRSDDS